VGELFLAKLVDVVEPRGGDDQHQAIRHVTPGQGISDGVQGARLIFDREVKPEELPNPVVLRDRGETLVEEELQAIVVRPDDEAVAPEVWALVADGVNEADELPLIGGEGAMARRDGTTEEGDGVPVLEHHCSEAVRGGVALDDEGPREVRER